MYSISSNLDKPYICVFVKGSDESLGNFTAFFTHNGQLQVKVEYDYRYTLRQLICDETPKGNCICMSIQINTCRVIKEDYYHLNNALLTYIKKN